MVFLGLFAASDHGLDVGKDRMAGGGQIDVNEEEGGHHVGAEGMGHRHPFQRQMNAQIIIREYCQWLIYV